MHADGGVKRAGISKVPTGIEGFDEITRGGLPGSRTTLVLGAPGTGKTVFALQMLVNGARMYGEPGIFVAIEENSRQIIENAATFGWDLEELEREKLFFLDARISPEVVQAGEFDLAGLLASLEDKAAEMGARRIVFDSIDVLLTLLDDRTRERQEVYRIHDWLASTGLTGMLTSGSQGPDPLRSEHYSFMQFMADCAVFLTNTIVERVSVRELRVLKYRGSRFFQNEFPLVIGDSGMEIATLGAADVSIPAPKERVSSGVERLDHMLDGGYFRGSSTLITGAPGTAKSTLAGLFVEAACKRGERALFVSFDEASAQIVRNLSSVSIDLASHLDSGLLRIFAGRSEAQSAEEHLIELRNLIREHGPTCLVVDPLSAMLKAGGHLTALMVAQRLLAWTKSNGITLLVTSLLGGDLPEMEGTDLSISTVADNWIHLTYVVRAGERNRALTIVKARGTRHSNQARELILSDQGVTLTDVFTAGGEVLMGTLRWEKEQAVRAAQEAEHIERLRRQREFEDAQAELRARIDALQREYTAMQAEYQAEVESQARLDRRGAAEQAELGSRRRADQNGPDAAGTASEPRASEEA